MCLECKAASLGLGKLCIAYAHIVDSWTFALVFSIDRGRAEASWHLDFVTMTLGLGGNISLLPPG